MTQPDATIPTIDVHETATRLEADEPAARPLLVDVREEQECRVVRVAGATHIPMSTFAARHGELPRDRPLFVMCASGNRSAAASGFLLRSGWTDVANVAGGITAWEKAGLPVRRDAFDPGEAEH